MAMTSTDWRRCIQANYSQLLIKIDTQNGLYGDMKKLEVLVEQTLERIWEISDETERVSSLLEVIRQGDDNRFKKFCEALVKNGQTHIVNEFLRKCPETKDYSDAVVSGELAAAIRRDVPLHSTARNCLTRYWNDIAKTMELDEVILSELERLRIFEPIQVKKLKDTPHRFKRNEQALKFIERRCQRHYDMFYKLLASHNQQPVLYYMAGPANKDPAPEGEAHRTPQAEGTPETGCQPTGETVPQQATDNDQRTPEVVCSGANTSNVTMQQQQQQQEQEQKYPTSETMQAKEIDLKATKQTCQSASESGQCVAAATSCSSVSVVSQETTESITPGTPQQDSDVSSRVSNSQSHESSTTAPKEIVKDETNRRLRHTPSEDMLKFVQRQISRKDAYDVLYEPGSKVTRGSVLIIANMDFNNTDLDREGTAADIVNLQEMFNYLNIEPVIHVNLDAKKIKEACLEHRRNVVKKEHTVFALFVLSHGVLDCVLGTDEERVAISDLTTMFDGKNCESLRGKPRLFFIQACQGDKKTMGTSRDVTDTGNDQVANGDQLQRVKNVTLTINEKADEAVILAAYPGYVAWRNPEKGSYFVQFLKQVFSEQAHEEDFYYMMLKVTRLMDDQVMGDAYKQICVLKSTLKKKLYLLPY